jgi:hypothetical protein
VRDEKCEKKNDKWIEPADSSRERGIRVDEEGRRGGREEERVGDEGGEGGCLGLSAALQRSAPF